MKASFSSKIPCKLDKGEIRRVPQAPSSWVIAIHVCCPKCGYLTLAVNERDEMKITQQNDNVTFSRPLRCIYCQVLIHLKNGHFSLVSDDRTRHVQYK